MKRNSSINKSTIEDQNSQHDLDQRMLSSKFRFYKFAGAAKNSLAALDFENKPISSLIRDARKEYIDQLKAQIQRNREQINMLSNAGP